MVERTQIIQELEKLLSQQGQKVNDWFAFQYRQASRVPPLYASVDLRHSGYKIVPVDTNLFAAGFNHLSERAKERARISFKRRLLQQFPDARRILILGESHTRNKGYIENLSVLAGLLRACGAEVVIGRLPDEECRHGALEVEGLTATLTQQVVQLEGKRLSAGEAQWQPDMIVLNNDLSGGLPEMLTGLEQPVIPALEAGWHQRRKSRHFEIYCQLAHQFAEDFEIDCWKIATLSHQCGEVNFKERKNLDCVAKGIEEMLQKIQRKYDEYGVEDTPYVYIKADAGTYGMGVMSAYSPDDVLQMNKKLRNKMQVGKDGRINAQILVQEGVPTADMVADAPAEPMLYAVDGQPVGGAFRVNPERDRFRNLNARGMYFTGMCDREEESTEEGKDHVPVLLCNFQVYGLITRLANLAAARE